MLDGLLQGQSQAKLHIVHQFGLRRERADLLESLLHDRDPMVRGCAALSLARVSGTKSKRVLQTAYAEAATVFERALILCGLIASGEPLTNDLHAILCSLADELAVWLLSARWKTEFLHALSVAPKPRLALVWTEAMRCDAPAIAAGTQEAARPGPQAEASTPSGKRKIIFVCYSRADKRYHDDLLEMVRPLARRHGLQIWSDQDIAPGVDWDNEIESALAHTAIAVLLVTKDFLKSGFIQKRELPKLLQASQDGGVRIFWIACRPCLVEHTDIFRFQCANNPKKPLSAFRRDAREQELQRICEKLLEVSAAATASL